MTQLVRTGALAAGLAMLLLAGMASAQDDTIIIDPNADSTPADIRSLELTFQFNEYDIIAPTILVTPDGQFGFVNYLIAGSDSERGYVLVFRPQAGTAADAIVKAIPVGKRPGLMFFNPAMTQIWVVNLGRFFNLNSTCSISVIDVASQQVVQTIATPDHVFGFGSNVVFTPDGGRAFISATQNDQVLQVDTATYAVTAVMQLEAEYPYYYTSVGPTWLTMSHDGSFFCCVNTFNETVSVIDTASFTETHQVEFLDAQSVSDHYTNFTFRNNVLLNEDSSIGFIASAGLESSFLLNDRVYLFDPATGQKIKDDDGKDVTLIVENSPAGIFLDPAGELLCVQISSTDSIATLSYDGFPTIAVFKWPTLERYKILRYKATTYNMSRTSQPAFMSNGDGTYDLVFPSFSNYVTSDTVPDNEPLVRAPLDFRSSTSGLLPLGDGAVREVPVAVVAIPGTARFCVANYLTGTVSVVGQPKKPVFSNAYSVNLEEDRFSAVALLNLLDEPITFAIQSLQTNNSSYSNDDSSAGLPFYWVDDDSVAHIIDPVDITLQAGEQLVTMVRELVPDYDKVVNQHGFIKAVHDELPLVGLVYNGTLDDTGATIIRGDYLRIDQPMAQDVIFPYAFSTANIADLNDRRIETVLHYVNPYYNQMQIQLILFEPTGVANSSSTFDLMSAGGTDQVIMDYPFNGYFRLFNLDNLDQYVYLTMEGVSPDYSFHFACPPLNPVLPSASQTFHVPYYVVGNGFDTSVVLISSNNRIAEEDEDEDDPEIQQTHVRVDFYDFDGNLVTTREYDFDNLSRFELYLSGETALDLDRFDTAFTTGSLVLTVDRDNVCGAFSYQVWNPPDPDQSETLPPYFQIRNMAADAIPLDSDAVLDLVFPYTITIAPFETSYVLYNPGDQPVTAAVEVYDPQGLPVAVSLADLIVPPLGARVFFLGDPAVFGPVGGLDDFVGYMRVRSTNGQPFLAKSVQNSPEMIAIIPTM